MFNTLTNFHKVKVSFLCFPPSQRLVQLSGLREEFNWAELGSAPASLTNIKPGVLSVYHTWRITQNIALGQKTKKATADFENRPLDIDVSLIHK
jgi:hypothetical protein